MKQLKITLLLILFATAGYSQIGVVQECTDITPVFTSANVNDCILTADVFDAQGQGPDNFTYTWRIDGQVVATPSNSPHMFTYSFEEPGSHTVKATMRLNGRRLCIASVSFTFNIEESCDPDPDIIIIDPDDDDTIYPCPTNSDIHFNFEGGGGLCTDGQANITGIAFSKVDKVEWRWALGGNGGNGEAEGTTSPIEFGSGDYTGSLIVIFAKVFYDNGQVCDEVWKSFPLECGEGPGSPIGGGRSSEPQIYPNPAKNYFEIDLVDSFKVEKVIIKRFDGMKVKEIKEFKQDIYVGDLLQGIYFVELISKTKGSVVKKLIIQ